MSGFTTGGIDLDNIFITALGLNQPKVTNCTTIGGIDLTSRYIIQSGVNISPSTHIMVTNSNYTNTDLNQIFEYGAYTPTISGSSVTTSPTSIIVNYTGNFYKTICNITNPTGISPIISTASIVSASTIRNTNINGLTTGTAYSYSIIPYNGINTSGSPLTGSYTPASNPLLLYYPFNVGDIQNGYIADYSTGVATLNAVISSGTSTISTTTIKYGTGSLNLASGYITLPSITIGTNGMTICLWVLTTYGGGKWSVPVYLSDTNGNFINLMCGYQGSYLNVSKNSNGFGGNVSCPVSFSAALQHIVMVMTPTYVKYYVNNILVTTYTGATSLQNITYTKNYIGGNAVNAYSGYIDDLRIYNYTLTAANINTVYTGGTI